MMSFIADAGISFNNPYVLIIGASTIVLLSYMFNKISQRTNIPSVLLLILTGIGIQQGLKMMHVQLPNLLASLELLGIIGLIMIVLEAALDLELNKEKLPLVGKTVIIALLGLVITSLAITFIFQYMWPEMSLAQAALYAVPLGIMSSAIIIPSVTNLSPHKREFMIYESAFSDILGIMLFYFLISYAKSGLGRASYEFGIGLVATIIISLIAAYVLIYIFQDIKGHVKLFVLIAVLLLLYSIGKLMHLSPLIIILVFGLVLANHRLCFQLFKNPLKVDVNSVEKIEKEFHLITVETAFVVRTFFFVEFGMNIDLASLFDLHVLLLSLMVISTIYILRYVTLWLINKPDISPELNIAPRGLITVLLFYAIPSDYVYNAFEPGVLLYVIIISSVIMTYGLIKYSTPRTSDA